MANFAIKYLDKALDGVLDGIEHNVLDRVTTGLLDEFPKQDLGSLGPDFVELQDAINFWRKFDMEGKKDFVEAAHREIAASSGSSASAVRRRADVAEAALTEVGGALLGATDPSLLLMRVGELGRSVAALQRENKKLLLDAQAAESEASSAIGVVARAHELEEANQKLQEQLAQEAERTAGLQSEIRAAHQASADAARLSADLHTARSALSALQADHEKVQSELFEVRARQEEAAAATSTDAELAARDLEAAHERLRQLTWEADLLQKRVEASAAPAREGPINPSRESANDELLRALRQELLEARTRLAETNAAAEASEAQRIAMEQSAQQQLSALQEEVARRADPSEMEALRAQVSALCSLVDAHMEAEGALPEERLPESSSLNPSSLHNILQARNRRLAAEAADLKVRLEVAENRSQELAERVKELSSAKTRQADLIAQLEDDLLHSSRPGLLPRKPTIASASSTLSVASAGGAVARGGEASLLNGGVDAATASDEDGVDVAETEAPDTETSAVDLLDIVTGQRDRFRHRVEQLEEAAGAAQREMTALDTKLAAAHADNVALYEKIRYLQRFSQRPSEGPGIVLKVDAAGVPHPSVQERGTLGHRFSCGPLELGLSMAGSADDADSIPAVGGARVKGRGPRRRIACFPLDDDGSDVEQGKSAVEQRYARTYEAKLNPFAEFQQNEADSRVRRLAMHDRAILGGSKVLLASRVARVFAALYLIFIHAFVFALIYYAALSNSSPTASPVPPKP